MPPCRNCSFGNCFLPDHQPLQAWERELLTGSPAAKATFHLKGGGTISFDDVNIDSIGPSAEMPGVIGVEFMDNPDRIVHIPFVLWWEISYK